MFRTLWWIHLSGNIRRLDPHKCRAYAGLSSQQVTVLDWVGACLTYTIWCYSCTKLIHITKNGSFVLFVSFLLSDFILQLTCQVSWWVEDGCKSFVTPPDPILRGGTYFPFPGSWVGPVMFWSLLHGRLDCSTLGTLCLGTYPQSWETPRHPEETMQGAIRHSSSQYS